MRFNLFEEYFTYKEKYGEVEELDLNGNQITIIPEKWVFNGKKLYLYSNQIKAIPEKWVFNGETLDLWNNQITVIPEKWVFNGKNLNLNGNQITAISINWNTKSIIKLNSDIKTPTFYLEINNYDGFKNYIIPNLLVIRIQRFWTIYAYNPNYVDKDGFFTRPMARKNMLNYYEMVK